MKMTHVSRGTKNNNKVSKAEQERGGEGKREEGRIDLHLNAWSEMYTLYIYRANHE